jgi:hypothetical protein
VSGIVRRECGVLGCPDQRWPCTFFMADVICISPRSKSIAGQCKPRSSPSRQADVSMSTYRDSRLSSLAASSSWWPAQVCMFSSQGAALSVAAPDQRHYGLSDRAAAHLPLLSVWECVQEKCRVARQRCVKQTTGTGRGFNWLGSEWA